VGVSFGASAADDGDGDGDGGGEDDGVGDGDGDGDGEGEGDGDGVGDGDGEDDGVGDDEGGGEGDEDGAPLFGAVAADADPAAGVSVGTGVTVVLSSACRSRPPMSRITNRIGVVDMDAEVGVVGCGWSKFEDEVLHVFEMGDHTTLLAWTPGNDGASSARNATRSSSARFFIILVNFEMLA
jgi:hypothetical protein